MKKLLTIVLAAALAVGVLTGCGEQKEDTPSEQPAAVVSSEEEPAPDAQPEEQPAEAPLEDVTAAVNENPENMSPTTGQTDTTTTYKPVFVQIDNSTAGRRWQSGLSYADVVYETLIETDDADTRLSAVFNDAIYTEGTPDKIVVGSIRSSRYYHQWIDSEWDALYVHQGGPDTTNNPESDIWGESNQYIKQRITAAGKKPANANLLFKNDAGDPLENYAMTDVKADVEVYNYEPKVREPFKYYPLQDYASEKEIKNIKLSFRSNPGWTEYQYDAGTDKLTRYMSGTAIVDVTTDKPIEVQNVIVQYVPTGDMPGDPPRAKVDVFGEGPAEFIIHGKHLKGTWKRAAVEDSTKYYLESGEEVTLAPGNTWIAMHPNHMPVTIEYADGTTYEANTAG